MDNDIKITKNMNLGQYSPLELMEGEINEEVTERAKSVAQQRFMGMVDAYKKGDMPDASPAIKKAAKSMTKKEVKDFAKTKHKGLPEHVNESVNKEMEEKIRKTVREMIKSGELPKYYGKSKEPIEMAEYYNNILDKAIGKKFDEVPNGDENCCCSIVDDEFRKQGGKQELDGVKNHEESVKKGLSKIIKENTLREIIREALTEISNDTVDSAYMKAMSDTNRYGYDDPMGVRRRAQAANLKKMRDERLGFDPVAMTAKMRQNGTSGDPSIDRRWATWQKNHNDRVAGNRVYDREKGRWIAKQLEEKINESVHTELVKTLGKYTNGEATAEQANKAIMNLANSSNRELKESLDDEMKIWEERDKSEFGQILKHLQTIAEDCLIDAGSMMSSIRTVYALDGNEAVTVRRVKRCLSEYDIILLDDEGNVDIENSNSPEAAELVYKLSNLAPNGLNESKADDYQPSHFAVNKTTGKIVNGWDYRGYDGEELRTFKRDYFTQDLIDNNLDPKQYVILNKATCIRRGINPDDNSNWANA